MSSAAASHATSTIAPSSAAALAATSPTIQSAGQDDDERNLALDDHGAPDRGLLHRGANIFWRCEGVWVRRKLGCGGGILCGLQHRFRPSLFRAAYSCAAACGACEIVAMGQIDYRMGFGNRAGYGRTGPCEQEGFRNSSKRAAGHCR